MADGNHWKYNYSKILSISDINTKKRNLFKESCTFSVIHIFTTHVLDTSKIFISWIFFFLWAVFHQEAGGYDSP